MKRWICMALAVCFLLLPGLALGAQSPLQEISWNKVAYPSENTIKLVSHYAELTVRGSTSVNVTLTLENRGDTAVETYIGTPYPMDNGYQVANPQAWCEGQSLPLKKLKRSPEAGEGMPEDWYGWKLAFAPKQVRILTIVFTTDTKIESDGTRCVIYPLHYLRNFAEGTDFVQVVANMDQAPPYIYDPAPIPYPQQVDGAKSMTWSFADGKYPEQIVLKYKPTIPVIERYLEQNAGGDTDIGLILSMFERNQYPETIGQIDAYLSDNEGYAHKNALLTLKSICLQKLMQLDQALDLNALLLADPGFGDMNASFQNRIIYETAWIMDAQGKSEEDIYTYLTTQQSLVDADSVFGRWLDQQIWQLSPRPTPTPEPTPAPAATPAPEKAATGNWFDDLTANKVPIGPLDIPLLYLLGGGVIVVIVLVLVLVLRKGKSKRRYYYR